MSDLEIKKMRNILIHTDTDRELLVNLAGIKDWKLEADLIPGAHKHWLTQGETKVALDFITSNIAMTSNVLPHDSEHNQEAANSALKSLSLALTSSGIKNSITASDFDLEESGSSNIQS